MTASEHRIVFDTNVLISAALIAEGKPRRALMTALSAGQVLMSAATFEELETRLARKKFDKYLTLEERALFLFSVYPRTSFGLRATGRTASGVPLHLTWMIPVLCNSGA